MPLIQVPAHVEAVFREFFTCELTTLGRDGTPITWPLLPIYRPAPLQFVVLTPVGLSRKAVNIRRNPRVSLLFSDPTGSDLVDPPAVLVQGDAEAPDTLTTSLAAFDEDLRAAMVAQTRKLLRRQPGMRLYTMNPLARYLMDWYFIRLAIYVRPRRILWWEGGDVSRPPHKWVVSHVG